MPLLSWNVRHYLIPDLGIADFVRNTEIAHDSLSQDEEYGRGLSQQDPKLQDHVETDATPKIPTAEHWKAPRHKAD